MICTSVKFSDLYRHLRIDAEFYKPEYLVLESKLGNKGRLYPLRKYCEYIKKGIFDISPDLYTTVGIPLIRTSEIKNPLVNFSTTVFLDVETHQEHYKTELKPNDIVITKIGAYIGDIAILPTKHERYNFSQNVTGLSVTKGTIDAKYLFVFLLSRIGYSQLTRITMLSGQGKIELEDIRDISIYEASAIFQSVIADAVEKAQSLLDESETKYQEAQDILLSELNLSNWQPEHQLSFVKNYSDLDQCGRMDAEYFQPKYDEIVEAIKRYSGGWDTLENMCELVGHPSNPPYAKTEDEDKTFIVTQKHLGEFSLNDEFWKDDDALYTTADFIDKNKRFSLKKNDVLLYSVGAYIGKANVYLEDIKATIGSFLTLLRAKEEKINGYVLMVFLNTDIGIMLSKQHQRGMAQQYLYPYDIRTFPVPLLKSNIQAQIRQKVEESFSLRKQSKHLLECAKRAVEIAIEQDEESAMQWLKEQTSEAL